AGSHAFMVTLETSGKKTITITDQANPSFTATSGQITVLANPFSKFAVSVLGGNTVVAGSPFLFTVQATDQFGNPVTTYSGPTSITTTISPLDPLSNFPLNGMLSPSGFGFCQGNLKTVGSYTISVTAGAYSGSSSAIAVTSASAVYFTVAAPTTAITG